jgi:hypothetical protein
LSSSIVGITVLYDTSGNPTTAYEAGVIEWADVCIYDGIAINLVQADIAHELGHTIGLAHNDRDTNSIMYPTLSGSSPLTPDSNDIGSAQGCPNVGTFGGLGGGITCIYGWGD